MNITIKQIRAFIAVAQLKSFAEACEQVHLSQPALSIAIKNLEEIIGGQLFIRSTRVLSLTPEGQIFLPVAQRLLADWDGALKDLHNMFVLNRGHLTIAAMPSFASTKLSQHIKNFRDLYPTINIKIFDVIAEDAIEMVRSGKVEFAISFDPGSSEDLKFEALFDDQFVAALPCEHPLVKEQALNWHSLALSPFIALQQPSSIRQLIDNKLAAEDIYLNIEFETNQLATAAQLVVANLGVSALPSLFIDQMQALGLVCRPLTSPVISRQVGIISKHRYPLSQSAQAFIKVIKQHYH